MPRLKDIVASHERDAEDNAALRTMTYLPAVGNEISGWLGKHELDDCEVKAFGSSSLVLKPKDADGYIIRISSEPPRSEVPQLVQPIFQKTFGDRFKLHLEFIEDIEAPAEEKQKLLPSYQREIEACKGKIEKPLAYSMSDYGVFRRSSGKQGPAEVLMAMDASAVKGREAVCTPDYPTLDEQWERHLQIIRNNPKLEALIRAEFREAGNEQAELPNRFPETKFVAASQPTLSGGRT